MSIITLRSCHLPALALAGCLATAASAAVPELVPYPAPGGNSATYAGSPIAAGGAVWGLADFNPKAYTNLYYTIGDYAPAFPDFVPGAPKLTMDGSTDALAFDPSISDLAHGIVGWSGSTQAMLTSGSPTVYTRFLLRVSDGNGQPLALVDPAGVGLPSALGGVLDVGGGFQAGWQFQASWNSGSGYSAAGPFFDALPGRIVGYELASSVGGAFYATPPVPEPATFGLMMAGIALLSPLGRRYRR